MQLSLQDCLDMVDLTEDEIAAVAEHEHVPLIVATELANYIINEPDGVPKLKSIILDDIKTAEASGDAKHAAKLRAVLRHFVLTHPGFDGAKTAAKAASKAARR